MLDLGKSARWDDPWLPLAKVSFHGLFTAVAWRIGRLGDAFLKKRCYDPAPRWRYPSEMAGRDEQEYFMRLWTTHQRAVANYLHAVVRDRATADDLLQETALHAFRRFAEYDRERPFVAWALGIARFKVLGLRRDHARSRVIFHDEALERFTESWAEQASEPDHRSEALGSCIDKLPSHSRRVVRLRYFDEMTADQIAGRIGGKGPSIRVTLQRIRRQLRECVERVLQTEGGGS